MKYRSGKTNIADCLSRLTQIKTEKSRVSRIAEDYIFMTVNAVPGALTAHDIEEASVKDTEVRNLRHAMLSGTIIGTKCQNINMLEVNCQY